MFRDAPVEVWAMTKNPMMVLISLPESMQILEQLLILTWLQADT